MSNQPSSHESNPQSSPAPLRAAAPFVLALGEDAPQIAEDAFLAPGCFITGDVRLGPQVSVWYGASIRADHAPITIGARSNVQDNAALHADPQFPCTVGEDVTIGHAAVVHGCTVGAGTTVGMGAVIMNGATIGENCLIAGGAVILEGAEIPAGSLVAGVPGKVRRELTDAEREHVTKGAEHYLMLSAKHREALQQRES